MGSDVARNTNEAEARERWGVMVEGDPKIVEWQVWDERDREPSIPDGLAAGGPWFPFNLIGGVVRGDGGPEITMVVVYRRPLVRLADTTKGSAWRELAR